MSVKLRVVLPVVVLGFALAGCSSNETGKATAVNTPSTTSGSSPTSSSSGTGLAEVDPCSLLKSADVSRLKLTTAEKLDENSCQWRAEDRTLVRLNTYPKLGVKDYELGPNSEPSDIKLGTHDAKLIKKALTNTSCAVVIKLTDTSSVDVNATGSKLDGSCAAAQSIAEAIEPNLP
ncbi:DUF3558 family protein [Lentzea pudingi]|nr:DUF3558 family protein [Lentzea pudingi]